MQQECMGAGPQVPSQGTDEVALAHGAGRDLSLQSGHSGHEVRGMLWHRHPLTFSSADLIC